jgi:hypothetical protein
VGQIKGDDQMPSTDELQKRAQLRQLRKQQQQANVEQAHTEAVAQSAKSEQNEAAKKPTQPADKVTQKPAAPSADARAKTKAQQKAAAKRAAEAQADKDARRSPEPVDMEKFEAEAVPGSNLSLHQLNAIAEKLDREVRDEGKEVAAAAAKGAYETYVGRLAGKRSRHAHMRAQIQAGEQQIAARRAAEARQQAEAN